MRRSKKEQYFITYLASSGGKMKEQKLMTDLIKNRVVAGGKEFRRLAESLKEQGYISADEDGNLISVKKCYGKNGKSASLEDIYMNDSSKVDGDVMLTPNAITQNPTMFP